MRVPRHHDHRPNTARGNRPSPLGYALIATGITLSAIGLAGATSTGASGPAGYEDNLEMIRNQTFRNRIYDDSADRNTAQADLVPTDHYGPRSDYLEARGGRTAKSFPVAEGGQFRAECEFSHFSYDDPIVYPNQPGAAHLHMFWGNTDVNAYSTYDSLANSGSSTCAGQELNRTAYWAPAMIDADGNARVPETVIVYYKGYGQAIDEAIAYPPGAAMVQNENLTTIPWNDGGTADPNNPDAPSEYSFNCSDNFRGARSPNSKTAIPVCDGSRFFDEYGVRDNPRATLEMHVKFANCWNGEDPSDPANWGRAREGGWFYSECNERATTPNIEYIIAYTLEIGETTEGWYLSSDVDGETFEQTSPGGATIHADWWGGWHPQTNQMWLDNCTKFSTNRPSGCGFGYLTDGGPDNLSPLPGPALRRTENYEGPIKIPATDLYGELCQANRTASTGNEAMYCTPGGHDHGDHDHGGATTTVPAATTTSTTTTSTAPATTVAATAQCGSSDATLVGTNGDDVLRGTPGNDVIVGLDGDDLIFGNGGDDLICAGAGYDWVRAGAGDDTVLGGPGDDNVFGQQGADDIRGEGGADRLRGGSGDDVLDGGLGGDDCSGGPGDNAVRGCESESVATQADDLETAIRLDQD